MSDRICPKCGQPQQWEMWRRCACGYDFGPPSPTRPASADHLSAAKPPAEAIVITRRYALPRLIGEWLCWLALILILVLLPRPSRILTLIMGYSAILLRGSIRQKGPQRASLELLRPDIGIPVMMFQLAIIALLSPAGRSWSHEHYDVLPKSFLGLSFLWLLWLDIRCYSELPSQPNLTVPTRTVVPFLVTPRSASFLFVVAWLLIGISVCAAFVPDAGIFGVLLFCTALFFRPSPQDNPGQKVSPMDLCLVAAIFLLAVVVAPLRAVEYWRNDRFASLTCVIPIALLLWPLWLDIGFVRRLSSIPALA